MAENHNQTKRKYGRRNKEILSRYLYLAAVAKYRMKQTCRVLRLNNDIFYLGLVRSAPGVRSTAPHSRMHTISHRSWVRPAEEVNTDEKEQRLACWLLSAVPFVWLYHCVESGEMCGADTDDRSSWTRASHLLPRYGTEKRDSLAVKGRTLFRSCPTDGAMFIED